MAIKQEKRPFAPRPQVQDTDYGAQFIKAATETSVNEVKDEEPETEEPVAEAPVVEEKPAKAEPAKKGKAGRPKKK